MKPHIQVQHEIKAQSEETINSFQDCYNWQKEMKEKEKSRLKGGQSENRQIPDVRSKSQNSANKQLDNKKELPISETQINNGKVNTSKKTDKASNINEKPGCSDLSKQNEGDLCKEKGNNLVKLGKHEEALYFYTAAINHFDKEPIYFANRALCYLKLEKYKECIKDCDLAIALNKTNIKAHYRRMQAYEFLGENEEALKDCQNVLNLDPKNTEAKISYQRILNRIKKTEIIKEKKPAFTNISENIQEIEMYNKPPHLRSKKSMKKIKINEVINGKPSQQVHISDEVIDKLFTNNNIGHYEEVKKTNKIQDKASIHDINLDNSKNELKSNDILSSADDSDNIKEAQNENHEVKPQKNKKQNINDGDKKIKLQNKVDLQRNKDTSLIMPTTSAQFYTLWKEIDLYQRYLYLKMIPVNNLNKILGAAFDLYTLIDILEIIHNYYLKDNLEILHILKELTKHEQFSILKLFLSREDRHLVIECVEYMKMKNNDPNDIQDIEDMYYLTEEI